MREIGEREGRSLAAFDVEHRQETREVPARHRAIDGLLASE